VLQSSDVVGNLRHLAEGNTWRFLELEKEQVREGGLGALDLRGEDRLLADVGIEEERGVGKQSRDAVEISAAGNWHVNHFFDIEGEVVHTFGAGGIHGRAGSLSGIGTGGRGIDLTEGTLGVAWHITKRLKIEQGGILRSDGTWQVVFAWEFSFAGD